MALESFFLMGVKPLVENSPTWKLHQVIDWEAVSRKLKGHKRWSYHRKVGHVTVDVSRNKCACLSPAQGENSSDT